MKNYLLIVILVMLCACASTYGSKTYPTSWNEGVEGFKWCKNISGQYHVNGQVSAESAMNSWNLPFDKPHSLIDVLGLSEKYQNVTHVSLTLKEGIFNVNVFVETKIVGNEVLNTLIVGNGVDSRAKCYEDPVLIHVVNKKESQRVFFYKTNGGDLVVKVVHHADSNLFVLIPIPNFTDAIFWYRFKAVRNVDLLQGITKMTGIN